MWRTCIFLSCAVVLLVFPRCDCHQTKNQVTFSRRETKGWGWEASSTFFDIALTALAFLSFGIFLLNLLVNALLYPTSSSALPPLITSTDPILTMTNGGGTGGPIVTGTRITGLGRKLRRRRAAFAPELDQQTSVKYFASFVINSIETMRTKHECLPALLCDANRKSKVLHGSFRVLVPFFSISMSYLGKLFRVHNAFPAHLNAIRTGLEEDNCQLHFPKCK